MRAFKLPDNQVIDFIAAALLMRSLQPGRIPLRDEEDLLEFALQFTSLATLWDACPRSDWMLWLVEKAGEWKLIPKAMADFILKDNELVTDEWLDLQADLMRGTIGNPFAFINEVPLIERRKQVGYWLMDGHGPRVPRICALFKPTVH